MPRPTRPTASPRSSEGSPSLRSGIFGPDWAKWRGATLRVELNGEEPFAARFEEVRPEGDHRTARLSVLNAQGQPIDVRTLPWPPAGRVRVVRAP